MGGEIASCRSKNGIFDRSETIGLHLVPGSPVGHLEIPKCPMIIRGRGIEDKIVSAPLCILRMCRIHGAFLNVTLGRSS